MIRGGGRRLVQTSNTPCSSSTFSTLARHHASRTALATSTSVLQNPAFTTTTSLSRTHPSSTTSTNNTLAIRHYHPQDKEQWRSNRPSYLGHNFPDFIEHWNRTTFQNVGYALGGTTAILAVTGTWVPSLCLGTLTAAYWKIGLEDIKQTKHAIRRNYPVLGNMRYILETIRPEIRQYLVEDDLEGRPFDRMHRSLIYQRAKNVDDTLAFGTRRDVYASNHEWACHSMWVKHVEDVNRRVTVGTAAFGTTQPYSASVLNVSAMSYGAISENAIWALSRGAAMGDFYHVGMFLLLNQQNTGEGGVSAPHKDGGGDLVWNVGTGYFGCGQTEKGGKRVFDPELFKETIQECEGQIKMVEIKLSQGAKPGHGGILPMAKITPQIASARKLDYPPTSDCHSPPTHSAFNNPKEMIQFIMQMRELSGGIPIGIKLCVGNPKEIAALVHAMVEMQNGPDFITVDGAEGGTGAAPPEFSNSIGTPLHEGIVIVRNLLEGAGMKDKVKIVASGRVSSGFSLCRSIALGADLTCAARAFMLSLGCIQALKCNTNKCPTGIATQNKDLQHGLDPQDKSVRVFNFHRKTVEAASEIVGTCGLEKFDDLDACYIMRRVNENEVKSLEEQFPSVESGCLLKGTGPADLQRLWDETK
eukprot:Nitzschia sp. Nitz4//scaffold44_size153857//125650//127846//NITZ4_002743-RA/size153857-augustus-gene-0.26-mRNA-1//-1//CDS//3329552223//5695//frame0